LLAIIAAQMSGEVPRPSMLRSDLPVWIDNLVAKGLAKSPSDRWPSVAAFGEALAAGSGSGVTTSLAVPRPPRALEAIYDVGERVGPGRLGSEIFRGVHRALGHPVAIRILRAEGHPNWAGARARFLHEARALQVAHESIIQVRDYGEEPGLVYLVTDFIEGLSVRALLDREGAIPWTRLRPLLDQLFDAVRHLHRRHGLICGMSPEIMRIRTPTPATDGADAEEGEPEHLLISTAGIWSAQDLLATLHDQTLRGMSIEDVEIRYVAPELLTGGTVDQRSDIFTIGVLAYEMATGREPFDGRSMPELLGRMLAGAPVDPRTIVPDLPAAFAEGVLRALRPSPPDRFQSVRAMQRALLEP
jgi:serine/threonine-protein kinase